MLTNTDIKGVSSAREELEEELASFFADRFIEGFKL